MEIALQIGILIVVAVVCAIYIICEIHSNKNE